MDIRRYNSQEANTGRQRLSRSRRSRRRSRSALYFARSSACNAQTSDSCWNQSARSSSTTISRFPTYSRLAWVSALRMMLPPNFRLPLFRSHALWNNYLPRANIRPILAHAPLMSLTNSRLEWPSTRRNSPPVP